MISPKIRLPKALHKELAIAARQGNISINSYILSLLSYNYGKTQLVQSNSFSVVKEGSSTFEGK